MSKKPDGTNGKKSAAKSSVYKAKSTKPAKCHELQVEHNKLRVWAMKVPRGTARAKRREGVESGWRYDSKMIQMRSAAM